MKTIECVECGESVPYGRLSCPACGALLASVAGGRKSAARVATGSASKTDVVEVGALEPDEAPASAPEPEASQPAKPAPAEPEPLPVAAAVATAVAIEPLLPDLPVAVEEPSLWPPLEAAPPPSLTPREYRPPAWASVAVAPERSVPRMASPGAYRPPSFSLAAAGAGVAAPAWPNAGNAGDVAVSGVVADEGAAAMTDTKPKSLTGAIDAARLVEIAGWFVVVGSTLAVLGFFLPWSRTVIGAASFGDYFDAWGLASASHMLVLAGLLGVLALGIVRTTVPIWIRTGILGLGVGALLVGLVWPYVIGPLGADVGVLCVGLGGVAMVIGGAVASWATRHAEVEPVV